MASYFSDRDLEARLKREAYERQLREMQHKMMQEAWYRDPERVVVGGALAQGRTVKDVADRFIASTSNSQLSDTVTVTIGAQPRNPKLLLLEE